MLQKLPESVFDCHQSFHHDFSAVQASVTCYITKVRMVTCSVFIRFENYYITVTVTPSQLQTVNSSAPLPRRKCTDDQPRSSCCSLLSIL